MAQAKTDFFLPTSLPYPITVVSLDAPTDSDVTRGSRLLTYSFVYRPKDPDAKPATRFGTWDSTTEGKISRWSFKKGDVISLSRARQQPAVVIEEPCSHDVQFAGLCAICGKNMDVVDYTGFSETSRASIQMTHSAFGPTVSLAEAQRIERETANHLLNSRKLSLIVDLDQTIVHATVDPTVGEWIQEGEAWEAKQAKKQTKSTTPAGSDDSDEGSDEDSDDEECNPNWEAIKDVKKFRLGPDAFVHPSLKQKGKNRMVEADGCMYYIKPRPGWKEFLEEAASKYEMHVYTMGTRAYAEQVCAIIDADHKLFGDRILSRDESGSLTQKSLQRLFPCDTSMVVIIDDRADVWEWSPNLVKVIPYDFFVGIGDINSTFLPKLDPSTPRSTPPPAKPPSPTDASSSSEEKDLSPADDAAPSEKDVLVTQNNAVLAAQVEERPLAKKEKELQGHEKEAEQTPSPTDASKTPTPSPEAAPEHPHHRKALLKNDDRELIRVGKLLDEVHRRFFAAHTAKPAGSNNKHKGTLGKQEADVTRIIPRLRQETLQGCHLVFSGLIPLDMRPETAEVWRSATMFGAKCHTELNKEVTHVVAATRGTVKVDQARKRGNISIVSQAWLTDSIAHWRRMEEKPYLLEEPTEPPPNLSNATSQMNDPGSDDEDWEETIPKDAHDTSLLRPAEIDWSLMNDEVDAAMMEDSDEEDETYIGAGDDGTRSEASEDWSDNGSVNSVSANNTPNKKKRLRSVTPSEGGEVDVDSLRSPLSKRKKLAADRSGLSRLKEGISAADVGGSENGSQPASPRSPMQEWGRHDEEDGESAYDDGEPIDDFLADFLEEELDEGGAG